MKLKLHALITCWEVSGCVYALAVYPLIRIEQEAGWALEPVWILWEENNLCSFQKLEQHFGCPACSLVTILFDLSWL
jgi:hypothetical protein